MELTQEYIKNIFEYIDGSLFWKEKTSKYSRIIIGTKAGNEYKGYVKIKILGKKCFEHRLIFLYHFGYLPSEIDHIDGNGLNNKIENLRKAIRSQNSCNKKISKLNTSGYKGVYWNKFSNKWMAYGQKDGKLKYLGRYESIDDAILIAENFRIETQKEFYRKS